MSPGKIWRCAIYTRVSSDQGLEQDFNSLDAQREAAEAYIKSQAHEGWRLRREHYDDGGFSGGSMERPAIQMLLADIAERRIDIVVVYKVDRLTRSLADFAKLVELFDSKGVSFVSVTKSFSTTTSMGRLTLNVLLSFAQFEREVTGERIRDKISASKKKGIWMGGVVPLGYRVESRKLVVDAAEAEVVRLIFHRYLELASLSALQADLRDRGIRRRSRVRTCDETGDGFALTNGPLAHILKNRMYLGEINHRGLSYKGEHSAIVDPDLFEAAQAKLTGSRNQRELHKGNSNALLKGCLFDDRGNVMSPSHALKKGVRYRYYVSSAIQQGRKADAGTVARVPAAEIEQAVLDGLCDRFNLALGDNAAAHRRYLNSVGFRATLHSEYVETAWTDPGRAPASNREQRGDGEADNNGEQRQRLLVPFSITPHSVGERSSCPRMRSTSGRSAPPSSRTWLVPLHAAAPGFSSSLPDQRSPASPRTKTGPSGPSA